MPENQKSKFIPILLAFIVLAVGTGITVVLMSSKEQNDNNSNTFKLTTNDIAVYEIKEGEKLTLIKANLDGSGSSEFYNLKVQKPASNLLNPFPQTTIMDNKIFRSAIQNDSSIKGISLNGKEFSDPIVNIENPFLEKGSWIISPDGSLKMELQANNQQKEINILTRLNEKILTIYADQSPRKISEIHPAGFSKDNNLIYFTGLVNEDTQGLFAFNRIAKRVDEIHYPGAAKLFILSLFDSQNGFAYFLSNGQLGQLNILTKEVKTIVTLDNSYYGEISKDKKYIFLKSVSTPRGPLVMVNTETQESEVIPISGEFMFASSDNRFLIYAVLSHTPYGNSVNIASPTGEPIQNQEFLDRTEYRSFDLQTRKDILLVADEQISNTFQSRKKEVTFLGLIASNNQNQNSNKNLNNQGFNLNNINDSKADQSWKTYHNDKYNYSFTYPTELTINDGKYNQDDVLFKDPSGLTPDVIQISASLFKDPNIFTLDDWIKNYSQETYVKERDIVIDVVPGIIVGVKVGDEVISSNKQIIFMNNNILFEISFHESSGPGLALNQVINSFVKNFKLEK